MPVRSLQGQLWRGPTKSHTVTVELEGPAFAQAGVADLVKAALLKGMLPAVPTVELEGADVNMVNAQLLAAEAGIKLTLNRTAGSAAGSYANQIRVVVDGPTGQRVAAGTVIEGQPRIVQVSGCDWTLWGGGGGGDGVLVAVRSGSCSGVGSCEPHSVPTAWFASLGVPPKRGSCAVAPDTCHLRHACPPR
jgi:hypothetical protein